MAIIDELLLTFEDIQSYIPDLANNYDRRDIEAAMFDTQRFDLAGLIGAGLYRDCYVNKTQVTPTNYVSLISGDTYLNCHGQTVDYYGFIPYISYIVLSRLIQTASMKITRSGAVRKTPQESVIINDGSLKTMLDLTTQKAAYYRENILSYLCSKSQNYSLYLGCNSTSALPKSQIFTVISGRYEFPEQGSSFRYY